MVTKNDMRIPSSGLTRKPKPSIEDQAADLVEQANEAALHYNRTVATALDTEAVADAVAYGYMLGQLRCRSKEIVGEAFAQRFQMSDEEFATGILGG